jgi:uncharacterized membrane protein YeaQ/YmgE (transglycosylase-associated protein family)
MFHILGWALFGLIVGAIAKLLMPGKDPGGMIVTMLLGVCGSLLGGFIGRVWGGEGHPAGWIGSIACTILILFVYRLIMSARHPRPA